MKHGLEQMTNRITLDFFSESNQHVRESMSFFLMYHMI